MSLTVTYSHTGPYSWEATWSTTGTVTVYHRGAVLLDGSTEQSYSMDHDSDTEAPALEVFSSTESGVAEQAAYSPCITMQWRSSTSNTEYVMERYSTDSTWDEIRRMAEIGAGYNTFATSALIDGADESWRVACVDDRGYQSAYLPFAHTIVANPEPPSYSSSYTAATRTLRLTT